MVIECNNFLEFRRVFFKSFSLVLPSGTKWATFLDTDAHDPTYKLSIPFQDEEFRLTCDNFLGDWEEAQQFARDQYQMNSSFSPPEYNQDIVALEMPDQIIKAINYHYSSSQAPAQWVHVVFLDDQNGVKRFVMTKPILKGENSNLFFVNLIKSYKQEL